MQSIENMFIEQDKKIIELVKDIHCILRNYGYHSERFCVFNPEKKRFKIFNSLITLVFVSEKPVKDSSVIFNEIESRIKSSFQLRESPQEEDPYPKVFYVDEKVYSLDICPKTKMSIHIYNISINSSDESQRKVDFLIEHSDEIIVKRCKCKCQTY